MLGRVGRPHTSYLRASGADTEAPTLPGWLGGAGGGGGGDGGQSGRRREPVISHR